MCQLGATVVVYIIKKEKETKSDPCCTPTQTKRGFFAQNRIEKDQNVILVYSVVSLHEKLFRVNLTTQFSFSFFLLLILFAECPSTFTLLRGYMGHSNSSPLTDHWSKWSKSNAFGWVKVKAGEVELNEGKIDSGNRTQLLKPLTLASMNSRQMH